MTEAEKRAQRLYSKGKGRAASAAREGAEANEKIRSKLAEASVLQQRMDGNNLEERGARGLIGAPGSAGYKRGRSWMSK